jgi:hypothetical protein
MKVQKEAIQVLLDAVGDAERLRKAYIEERERRFDAEREVERLKALVEEHKQALGAQAGADTKHIADLEAKLADMAAELATAKPPVIDDITELRKDAERWKKVRAERDAAAEIRGCGYVSDFEGVHVDTAGTLTFTEAIDAWTPGAG